MPLRLYATSRIFRQSALSQAISHIGRGGIVSSSQGAGEGWLRIPSTTGVRISLIYELRREKTPLLGAVKAAP